MTTTNQRKPNTALRSSSQKTALCNVLSGSNETNIAPGKRGSTAINTSRAVLYEKPSEYQGAFIDHRGREVPITEQMIQDACKRLESAAISIYAPISNALAVTPRNQI